MSYCFLVQATCPHISSTFAVPQAYKPRGGQIPLALGGPGLIWDSSRIPRYLTYHTYSLRLSVLTLICISQLSVQLPASYYQAYLLSLLPLSFAHSFSPHIPTSSLRSPL